MTTQITNTTDREAYDEAHATFKLALQSLTMLAYDEIIEALPHLKDIPDRDIPQDTKTETRPFEILVSIDPDWHELAGNFVKQLKEMDIEAFGTPVLPEHPNLPHPLRFDTAMTGFLRALCFTGIDKRPIERFDIFVFGTRK